LQALCFDNDATVGGAVTEFRFSNFEFPLHASKDSCNAHSKLSGVQTMRSRYNRMMPVKLIALDIDGTLLDSRWQVSEPNRQAIAEAARRGIEVALVTGRRYDFAMPVARQLDVPLTMIVNNGALIRSNDGRTHLRHLLPRRVAEQVLRLTKPWREGAAVVFDRPAENQVMLERLDPDDSLRYAYYSRNKQFIGFANPLETCLTEDPIQVMLSGNVAPMREAEQALRGAEGVYPDRVGAQEFALAVTLYEARDFAMIDVLNPICSKGASLAEWATLRGLAREEVMAIGDNHNDLEMLTFAGIPVVMGNSVPELKTYGWHETRTNDENGVAHAIEQFALREAAPWA
jgi:Cof subfamily protein (haloacid dehalogenase superfamily)